MPIKNIFDKPFDEGTIAKLEIFENYLNSWLPTFIMSDFNRPIQIFDLFAGAGCDKNNVEGSPLRSLRIIKKHSPKLRSKKKIVCLYLNDLDENKILTLTEYCNKIIKEYKIEDVVKLAISNTPFISFLRNNTTTLDKGCNLIFLDQNGFKEVTENVFKYLIGLELSEFIFFISSSFIHRFSDDPEVRKFHPNFDFNKIKVSNRKVIHNIICREFEKYVPSEIKNYSVIPFSIMKSDKNNVYGLIFVSKHIRGADKFLEVVWKMNKINGNANYDIEEDLKKAQHSLFEEQHLTKIEAFQNNLKDLILKMKLLSNLEVYVYTLNEGHIPRHAHHLVAEMKRKNLIFYNTKSPLINYSQIFKQHRIIEFSIINETIKN